MASMAYIPIIPRDLRLCMQYSKMMTIRPTNLFPGGGDLYLKLDIILVKKVHVIRVVFQDQAMYVRTSFRGAIYILTNSGKDMTANLKNAYLRFIFIPEKYVFRVCFESPFTRMISSLKYKCPPPESFTKQRVVHALQYLGRWDE